MSSSPETVPNGDLAHPLVFGVSFDDETMLVRFDDGQTVELSLSMYPRLMHGTAGERADWRLIGKGRGVHWPRLDEDLSAEGLIDLRPSMESERSFNRWLEKRAVRQETA